MTRNARTKSSPTTPASLTPTALAESPERASVEALRAVLDIAVMGLLAAHPELLDESWPDPQEPPSSRAWVAHLILTHAQTLRREVDRYNELLSFPPDWVRSRRGDPTVP